eukprot:166999_1
MTFIDNATIHRLATTVPEITTCSESIYKIVPEHDKNKFLFQYEDSFILSFYRCDIYLRNELLFNKKWILFQQIRDAEFVKMKVDRLLHLLKTTKTKITDKKAFWGKVGFSMDKTMLLCIKQKELVENTMFKVGKQRKTLLHRLVEELHVTQLLTEYNKLTHKRKKVKCHKCGGKFRIKSDPYNAHRGKGIKCSQCGKNKHNTPKLVLEQHYYQCKKCRKIDLCSTCYNKL